MRKRGLPALALAGLSWSHPLLDCVLLVDRDLGVAKRVAASGGILYPELNHDGRGDMATDATPYSAGLTAQQAATAMQAARRNALELMDSAELLYTHKRFAHSLALSTLAIEEAGKLPLLQSIFLGFGGDLARLWKAYRLHRAKTRSLNAGIQARVRAMFPEMPLDTAKDVAAAGPSPADLETNKQRAIYSDCLLTGGEFVCHLPSNGEWRQLAWERLCEAQALAQGARDYTPEELDVWLSHAQAARSAGGDLRSMLPGLHKELLEKGFVKEGWWDTMLQDATATDDKGEDA